MYYFKKLTIRMSYIAAAGDFSTGIVNTPVKTIVSINVKSLG
jgi:hypothetical protein